jgi:MarR family transcriptional regulator, 2-MHQ and catechol-resistance regulon repressor
MPERFLKSIRLLAECYQAFEHRSNRHVRELGLTPAQFDVIATLGRTQGMTFKDLGEHTLMTKGTLSGVIDRMVEKKLLSREAVSSDGRKVLIKLSAGGEANFEQVFPLHVRFIKQHLVGISDAEFDQLDVRLRRLRDALNTETAAPPCRKP